MFPQHGITPGAFALRFRELVPEYLPGLDTGAFEPTDRWRCWNKTLQAILTAIGKEDAGLTVDVQDPMRPVAKDQLHLVWRREGWPLFAVTTAWGGRKELEISLEQLESYKCPHKLFVYSCKQWHDAVLDQISAGLLRYPYHIEGEQYIFMNLLGTENRFDLLLIDLARSGPGLSKNDVLLRTVAGSPFSWSTKKTRPGIL